MNSIKPKFVTALEVSGMDIHTYTSSGLCIVLTNLNMWYAAWLARCECEMNSSCLGDWIRRWTIYLITLSRRRWNKCWNFSWLYPWDVTYQRDPIYLWTWQYVELHLSRLCWSLWKLCQVGRGNERILYVYLGLLVFRGDNVVCFNANMLQYWTLVMSVWLEHILCSISCGIHWGYRRELRCSTSCNCLSRRWTSSSRDTMMFSIMCWTNLWYQPARIVFMLSYLKISWASLPLPNWEKTRIELCSETSLYL